MPDTQKDLRRKILGRKGEAAVCKYLKKQGYKILHRNFRTPFGEADIVAKKADTYCFIEVKARTSDIYGLPAEAVNREKQRRYRMIARYYCNILREEVPCRFDVAAIFDGGLEYYEGAFI